MACSFCADEDGDSCYPIFGLAPHIHINVARNGFIGSTVMLPPEEWPSNFHPSENDEGMGIYSCLNCGEGKPTNL